MPPPDGETGELHGVTYTKRDRSELDALIQARDWSQVVQPARAASSRWKTSSNLYEPIGDITSWDVSAVRRQNMFYNTGFFNQPIGHWNVSSVTNLKGMFNGALAFNHDISDWDVSKVTDFSYTFESASAFNQNIGNWDVSSATTMSAMFFDANAFNQDISGWDVANVTNMNSMFYDAYDFNQDLSGWCVTNIRSEPIIFVSNFQTGPCPSQCGALAQTIPPVPQHFKDRPRTTPVRFIDLNGVGNKIRSTVDRSRL